MMKRTIALLLLCLVGSYSYAQKKSKEKKPKIEQGEKARKEGRLDEAKGILDAAIVHEKTKGNGKTWFYHGLVYASLDTTSNESHKNLANKPLETAMASFAKSDELADGEEYFTTGTNGFPIPKYQQIDALWGYYLNQGVEKLQADELDEAVKYMDKTFLMKPADTTSSIYAGSVALQAKQYDKAKMYLENLINKLDHHSVDTYNSLLYISSAIDKDDEKTLEYVRAAKAKFPNNTEFAKTEINTLIRMDKIDEARTGLENAIKKEPNNANLLFTLGVMREETDDKEGAKEAYSRALKADPSHYNSQFNLSVVYYNEVVNLLTEKNNLGITAADIKKAKEMQGQIDEKLQAALPHWEKTNELKANDRTTLETLKYIYYNLKSYDKAEAVEKQLAELGGGE